MCKNIKIGFLLVLIFGVGVYAFSLLHEAKTRENYLFFGGICCLFTVVYCVSILRYKITGSMGIENALREIDDSRKEVARVAENVVKIGAILADGSGRFGGMPDVHKVELKKYEEALKDFLNPDLDKEIQKTINQLNLKIEEKNKK